MSAQAPVQNLPPVHAPSKREQKLQSILEVAQAMTAERNLDQLLPLILSQAARVVEADRCTLFVLDRDRDELWSKVAQGAASEIRVKNGQGIAGAVASSGAVLNLADAYLDERFNRSFDDASGYRTRSLLCVPMRDAAGEVTGVLQALNKTDGGPFTEDDAELLMVLGGQAAVAIENALLHDEINSLFEGFVAASVVAIESRDPTTAGHSGRVADLTVLLAQTLEHVASGPYGRIRFSDAELQELRYASLLHDFGKVGVREPVLVKAEKLYPHELELLRARFEVARQDRKLRSYERRLERVRRHGADSFADVEAEEEERLTRDLAELDAFFDFVLTCNRPTVLAQGGFERLAELSRVTFRDSRAQPKALLTEPEVQKLSIPRGSLSKEERLEIESHVEHTFKFLTQIPWTRSLRNVPEIAYAHHEKLNGNGYPRAIPEKQIPVQSKMMAISDIFDALTASDRPYKKAVPMPLALDILHQEAKAGQVDRDLLEIFISAEIPRRALGLK